MINQPCNVINVHWVTQCATEGLMAAGKRPLSIYVDDTTAIITNLSSVVELMSVKIISG